jgi:hypothetical protein
MLPFKVVFAIIGSIAIFVGGLLIVRAPPRGRTVGVCAIVLGLIAMWVAYHR